MPTGLYPRRQSSLGDVFNRIYARTKPENGCLVFQGYRDKKGYARVTHGKTKCALAHRLVAEYAYGPCPEGMEVRHMCGNGHKGCVTRSHLSYGTRSQNAIDRQVHGRNIRSRLNAAQVLSIRYMYEHGTERKVLAEQFNVSLQTIHNVVHRETWKWL